jgi:polysaccharide export outer membrane protein
VKHPGRYTPYVSQLNVLEALALAGDMTSYGNRTNVTIVREENGVQKIYKINLLDQNLITSKYFYLLPNDVLYVESLNAKTWGFEQFPYTLILSSLTTFIAMMTLIATLK